MKTYKPMECQSTLCRKIFTPVNPNQVYCCRECAKKYNDFLKREERKEKRVKKERRRSSWDEINAFIKRYEAETGCHITYGKAVLKMEQERKRGTDNG